MAVTVRPLECGWLNSDLSTILADRPGTIRMPVASFLIEHDRGNLLFDVGMHPDLADGDGRLGPIAGMFGIELDERMLVSSRLASIDVDPASISHVVLSHLHFDHCGGLGQLPDARVLLQRDEWTAASDPLLLELGVYNPADFDLGHDRLLLDGEHDVFGDGAVRVMPTPGHTAGHQSLFIEGRLLLVGDACYCRAALDDDVLPPITMDAEQQRTGFAWLRQQEAAGVELVFSHDPDQWAALGSVL